MLNIFFKNKGHIDNYNKVDGLQYKRQCHLTNNSFEPVLLPIIEHSSFFFQKEISFRTVKILKAKT